MLPPPPHNIINVELDFDVKLPLLRLLQFQSDLKSTIINLNKDLWPLLILCEFER